jgi:WD40 repeat protein
MMDRPKNMKIADDTTLLRKLPRQDGAIAALAWSPDGRRIAVAGGAAEVNVYDPETGTLVAKCKGHKAGIYTVAFSPDSTVAATAGFDGMVRLYDAATGDLKKEFVPVPLVQASAAWWDRRSPCVVCQPDSGEARQTTRGNGLSHLGAQ